MTRHHQISFALPQLKMKWLILFFLASSSDWIYCPHRRSGSGCQALSSSTSAPTSTSTSYSSTPLVSAYSTLTLTSLGKSQLAVLDGAEWNSVQSILKDQQKQDKSSSSSSSTISSTKYGYMKIVTGKDEENRRIVAMQCMDTDDNNNKRNDIVYEDSLAVIPQKVSDVDAISTYIASFSSIHCALPIIEEENVGGRKAVVLGSSDLACFSAEGLACMGMDVFMVNNKGNANVRKNIGKLQVIKPAVGDSDTAFSSHLGEFDSLVDTIGNEQSDVGRVSLGAESTLQMLKSRHKCHKYVSTLTHSQDIIASEGIFGGPRNADGYSEKIGNPSFLMNSRDCQVIPPPMSIGSTIKILMEKDVVFTEKQRIKACSKKSDAIRGWSLSDFWEQTSWPRDSSGMGTTRFGLPVRDGSNDNYDKFDDDDDDEFMISEAPYREQGNKGVISVGDDDDEVGEFSSSSTSSSRSSNLKNRAIQNNPYVINIMDIDGMESEIVSTEKDCIMFMSAKFCKTCKTINPAFTRMARINQENNDDNGNSNISFVKAETSGASGKELAKHVSVQAVPAFVFIRDGKILGQASVSKLPSKKIDTALKLFATGADWDYKLLDDDVDQGE